MPTPIRAGPLLLTAALLLSGCGGPDEPAALPPPVSPPASAWDLSRLPSAPAPTAEWTTPEGVRVLVLAPGRGEPAGPQTPMDVAFEGYLLSGRRFAQATTALNLEGHPRLPELQPVGLRPAFAGLKQDERRRVLVPAALAFGHESPVPEVPARSDVVYDVVRRDYEALDLQVGAGRVAKEGAWVTLHFRGRIVDGAEFEDSRSARDGQPISRRLVGGQGGFVPGFARGIVGMREGGMRRIHVPSRLAFGSQGTQVSEKVTIPRHSDLIFVVELLGVADAPPPGSPEASGRGARPPPR